MRRSLRSLNGWAVLTATFVYYVLGAAWGASPLGALFYRAIGFVPPEGWTPGMEMYLVPLAACFASALATALLAGLTGAKSLGEGLGLGLVVGLGYSVAVAANDAAAPSIQEPGIVVAILGGYHLVSLPIVGAIVSRWRRRPPDAAGT